MCAAQGRGWFGRLDRMTARPHRCPAAVRNSVRSCPLLSTPVSADTLDTEPSHGKSLNSKHFGRYATVARALRTMHA